MTRGYLSEDEPRSEDDGGVAVPNARALFASERAILVEFDGSQTWVPKSCIHDDSEVFDCLEHGEGKLVVKGWFARGPGAKAFRQYIE